MTDPIFTPEQVYQVILAVAGLIISCAGAIGIIAKVVRWFRKPALFMAFYMNDILQMRMGYDSVNEAYGVMAPEIHALGSGAGVKFDGSVDATVRGRFVWEIRDNGHFSLKRY